MRDLSNPLKLITLLSDGEFHSGEELAIEFGITRAGINKYIKLIKQWGLEITSTQGKGYQLAYPIDLLMIDKIEQYYRTFSHSALDFEILPVIDSTNQYLLDKIGELQSGFACAAEYQQAGRGRRGRQWFSPFGSNLYFSMYWRLEQGPAAAMGLSLVIGIVIANVLRQLSGQEIKVKWPNDLYLNDKKLAGILVELAGKTGDVAHVVMGSGINLMMHNPDHDIVNQAWANLGYIDRNLLVANLLNQLREAMCCFEQQGLHAFINEWMLLDNFVGRPVKLLIGDKIIKGIARGINDQGALLLEQDGHITPYIGGEISLRADHVSKD
ncbi:bifunctional biotin--[acetyl-CoA-carboxylase] ligase/biotin operon repressor BirA [Frischella sp. Ac13]|uniref:Bifunctional ligase/repressor BirA n=1 Tax=Frischella japonica TaxID=2741544 RepID=A0ABR7QW42_9GAMM|nr:bifunctional biotin--[acetyl-CoA-carboxylase] ligase/biotin operon repressor BirA [Frischella japonica]MBC9130446.1 bifunctional biotin--[acetyl-CoA-carboxylase] ligase/biotin operon repressor BirA [Frischella japonica]